MMTEEVRSPHLARIRFWTARRVKTNPLIYRLWLAIKGRSRYLTYFPDSRKKIMIEGYPSCANSFITNFVSELTGYSESIAHHTHSISSLKLSMRYGMTRIVILREPLEAVSSRYVRMSGEPRFNIDIANHYLSEYYDFYEFVYRNRASFCIVLFEELVTDINAFYLSLPIHTSLSKKLDARELDDLQRRVKSKMKEWFLEGNGFMEYDGIPLPDEERVQSRKGLKKDLALAGRFEECQRIHGLLRAYCQESKGVE